MIVVALLKVLLGLVSLLLTPLHLPVLPPEMMAAANELLGYVSLDAYAVVWFLLPRGSVMAIFSILVVIVIARGVYSFVMWIIRKVPGGMS